MKKILKSLAFLFLLTFCFCTTNRLMADPPAPPPPGEHGSGNNGPPVGAPIDGGLGILLAMGGAYGARKLYKSRKDKKAQEGEEKTEELPLQ